MVKMLKNQTQLDTDMHTLFDTMKTVFDLVSASKHLSNVYQQKIVMQMVQQTVECGYFIHAYAQNKKFCGSFTTLSRAIVDGNVIATRTLNNAFSGASDKIKNVNANFVKLRQAFQEQAFLQTELVAIRVEVIVQDIGRFS